MLTNSNYWNGISVMNLIFKYFYNIFLCGLFINCGLVFAINKSSINKIPEANSNSTGPFIFEDYEIHFSAFNTTFLSPEIAKAYNITRSGKYVVVNISVHKINEPNKSTQAHKSYGCCKNQAVKAKVTGTKGNLMSQKTKLVFREVIEGDAIYYLAEIKITDSEYLNFDLQVTPEDKQTPLPRIKANKIFYIEK